MSLTFEFAREHFFTKLNISKVGSKKDVIDTKIEFDLLVLFVKFIQINSLLKGSFSLIKMASKVLSDRHKIRFKKMEIFA